LVEDCRVGLWPPRKDIFNVFSESSVENKKKNFLKNIFIIGRVWSYEFLAKIPTLIFSVIFNQKRNTYPY
jgi:hypothetical protein